MTVNRTQTERPGEAPYELCKLLEWDSKFFGFGVGRILKSTLREDELPEIMKWAAREKVRCLYFLADPCCCETARIAAGNGFILVDTRLTFDCKLSNYTRRTRHDAVEWKIVPVADVHFEQVFALAGGAFETSRFFFDQNFPRDRVNELYRVWVKRCMEDENGRVFVASADEVCGFAACSRRSGNPVGTIELVAVAPGWSGRGIGEELVGEALEWFRLLGLERAAVVTQGRNIAAQRLYVKCGFSPRSSELWFHKWLS